jgi:hypothetical protein
MISAPTMKVRKATASGIGSDRPRPKIHGIALAGNFIPAMVPLAAFFLRKAVAGDAR